MKKSFKIFAAVVRGVSGGEALGIGATLDFAISAARMRLIDMGKDKMGDIVTILDSSGEFEIECNSGIGSYFVGLGIGIIVGTLLSKAF